MNEMINIASMYASKNFTYEESLDYFNEEEKKAKKRIVEEGLYLFEKIFGFSSLSFIANNYVWGTYLERTLKKNGVLGIKGVLAQKEPMVKNEDHSYRFRKHYTGQKNKLGQVYLVRNVFFEPSYNLQTDYLGESLRQINSAFKWRKPAIICSHRINYIGFIDKLNRDRNLKLLRQFFKEIKKKWPDVEFMNSEQLIKMILNQNIS